MAEINPESPFDPGVAAHSATGVVVKDRYQVFTDQSLPDLDSPCGAKAFVAKRLSGEGVPLFALVCHRGTDFRADAVISFIRLQSTKALMPVDFDVMPWPPEGRYLPVLIFEKPKGPRLDQLLGETFEPWREEQIRDVLLFSLTPFLRDLEDRNLTHRAIRLDNIFYADPSQREVILGECLSGPPAFCQPVLYEPIDSALSHPAGRGNGTTADDLYALGVLILVLMHGGNPIPNMTDEEIVTSKIERGSYATLVSKTRLSLHMVEILRGLLCDNPEERWTADDVGLWLNGRHLSPKQPVLPKRAQRGFKFLNVTYNSAELLAYALAKNWDAACEVVRNGQLELWVRRSLSDEKKANLIQIASAQAGESMDSGGESDRALAMALVALHPAAPLRLRSLSAKIDGVFRLLMVQFDDPDTRRQVVEILKGRIGQAWIDCQLTVRPEYNSYKKTYDVGLRRLLQDRPGYGLERVLYDYNPSMPCLSPLLDGGFVADIRSVLSALDRLAPSISGDQTPIDRHIVAFLAARHIGMPEAILRGLNDQSNEANYRLDMLRLLSEGQRAFGPPRLCALTGWFSSLCEPVLETYRSRATREKLRESMEWEVQEGSLNGLFYLIDDIRTRQQDNLNFEQAQAMFLTCAREMAWIRAGGLTEPTYVKRLARPVATAISAVAASFAFLVMTVIYVT
ncbi:MAG: hypothetical protein AAF530_21590 [Pseudomonadota bacterium]